MILRSLIFTLLLVTAPLAQSELPTTPAGTVFAEWLAAFNSGDAARLGEFNAKYREKPVPVDAALRFREMTGGFTLIRVEKSDPTTIVALVGEKDSDTIGRVEITVSAAEPVKIVSETNRAIPRPPDLAIPRLTEAKALLALSAKVDEMAAADRFSGVVLVARRGKIVAQKVAGRANREAGTAVTPETRFRNGSMNKMFTSIATLTLVEAGKLALDDPIGKHLADYPNKDVASKVTVRHLLTHTGGTGDIFGPDFNRNRLTLKEHADYLKLYGSRALVHEPGAEFRYSNYGFVLLGALIEKVSGTPYDAYVRKAVFEPAGMSSTGALPETDAVPNRSAGYVKRGGAWVSNADTLPWRGTAAGGGYTTAGDLLRFAQALESGALVSKKTLAEATTAHREGYGYGFGVRGESALRWYGHGGGAPGMNGELRIFPQLGYVLVALSNVDPPAASRMVDFFALRMPAAPSGS